MNHDMSCLPSLWRERDCRQYSVCGLVGANRSFSVDGAGLLWSQDVMLLLTERNIEPLLADLCTGCGTVIRFHVCNPNRNWINEAATDERDS
jgi:hypothetical protein